MSLQNQVESFQKEIQGFTAEQVIAWAQKTFGARVNFASSLGEEDQVITDMIARLAPQIEVFTLDTGRLHQETYDVIAETHKKYPDLKTKIYFPDVKAVEEMVNAKGVNLFYESVENRKLCCGIRKVEPLRRALANVDVWMTGLRRQQAVTRSDSQMIEWDAANQRVKINPLIDWSLDQVHAYIKKNNVPVNALHAKGFLSIGCAPCTRAVKPGEDIRAGRWWWENPEQKECGLHNNPARQAYLKNKGQSS